jgi:hypothetical protein
MTRVLVPFAFLVLAEASTGDPGFRLVDSNTIEVCWVGECGKQYGLSGSADLEDWDLQWRGLERFSREQYEEIVRVDEVAWRKEVESHDELLGRLGEQLPRELESRRARLHEKLAA